MTGKLDVRGVEMPEVAAVVDAALEQQLDVEHGDAGEIE